MALGDDRAAAPLLPGTAYAFGQPRLSNTRGALDNDNRSWSQGLDDGRCRDVVSEHDRKGGHR